MFRVSACLVGILACSLLSAAQECVDPGDIVCADDCSSVNLCMTDPAGGFLQYTVEECFVNRFCYANKKACIDINTCVPPDFECPIQGIFPDPYDCTKFYVCQTNPSPPPPLTASPRTCAAGTVFDSTTSTCSLNASDNPPQCMDNGVPYCRTLGQQFPYAYNPRMYFLCKSQASDVFYPALQTCFGGEVFQDGQCVPEKRKI